MNDISALFAKVKALLLEPPQLATLGSLALMVLAALALLVLVAPVALLLAPAVRLLARLRRLAR